MKKIVTMGKARQLYEILKEDISEGKYEDNSKLPSIRALADEYGMSKNTVNTAIAMLVSEGIATVREGNGTYVIRTPRKSRMIGVMMFDFCVGMRVETMILEHIQKALPVDYYLSLVNHSERYDIFCDSLEHLIDAGAAGLLIVPPKDNPKFIGDMQRVQTLLSQMPTVFINRSIPGIEMDTYSMDLKKGMEKALEYLHATGKRKTAIVLHDSAKFVKEELDAYEEYLEQNGLSRDDRFLIEWSDDIREIRIKLHALLGEFDSIIAPDNVMVHLGEVIAESGLKIPSELSLVAINDTLLSKIHNPPLTSISFPVERIGKNATQQLIRRIEGGENLPVTVRNYSPEFIIRKT